MMAFSFRLNRNKTRSPFWTEKAFEKLDSEAIPEDTKTFYTHHSVHAGHSANQEGPGSLFAALGQTRRHIGRISISSADTPPRIVDLGRKTELLIGSNPISDVHLVGNGVSRFHARLTIADGNLWVRDLHSQTGVFVNDRRISPDTKVELNPLSVLRIQNYCLRFEDSDSSGPDRLGRFKDRTPTHLADAIFSSGLIHHAERQKVWSPVATELRVTGIIEETADVKTFRLADRRPLLFRYDPGQHVTVIATIGDREVRRSYSLASTPSRPNGIEITVKRLPGGLVSNWLCDHLDVGDSLKVRGPYGRFSCFNHPARKLLFVAAGSGIVPIMSILCWIADTDARVDVKLLLSFRKPADFIYRQELELLAARYDNIDLQVTITGQAPEWHGHTGRIDRSLLAETVPDLPVRRVFLCGPELFMQSVTEALTTQGALANNIHVEHFFDPSQQADNRLAPETIRSNQGDLHVRFARSGLTVRCDETINLLDLALAHGIPVDSDCRTGSCGQCMVRCLKGRVDMSEEAEIDQRAKQAGWIYSCCAVPRSDVVLDL